MVDASLKRKEKIAEAAAQNIIRINNTFDEKDRLLQLELASFKSGYQTFVQQIKPQITSGFETEMMRRKVDGKVKGDLIWDEGAGEFHILASISSKFTKKLPNSYYGFKVKCPASEAE